jgi:lysophospholipase L1-like esterase
MTVDSLAYPGQSTTTIAGTVAADIAAHSTLVPRDVLLSMGSNDMGAAQAVFETNYSTILDAIHAAWPSARVFVTRSWIRNYDAAADIHAAAVAAVLATRGAFAFAGPDERVILKGADNGATNTADGVHASPAGSAALASDWLTRLGY